jgi:hypothetical protein
LISGGYTEPEESAESRRTQCNSWRFSHARFREDLDASSSSDDAAKSAGVSGPRLLSFTNREPLPISQFSFARDGDPGFACEQVFEKTTGHWLAIQESQQPALVYRRLALSGKPTVCSPIVQALDVCKKTPAARIGCNPVTYRTSSRAWNGTPGFQIRKA